MANTPIFTGSTNTQNPKNIFDLSNDRKFSGRMGNLMPILVIDTIPGDKITINTASLVRFAPLVAPVMHMTNVYIHYFFVPNRLLWSNFEKFITGGEDGLDNSVPPYTPIQLGTQKNGSISDYLGLPVGDDVPDKINSFDVSTLPFAAYNKIYQDYYRDQNLIPEDKPSYQCNDGLNPTAGNIDFKLYKRAWQHDYFTSALPFAQRGPEALLPLGVNAPIRAYDHTHGTFPLEQIVRRSPDGLPLSVSGAPVQTGNQSPTGLNVGSAVNPADDVYIDLNDTNYADLSEATASSIIDVRRAFKLQEYLEKNARGGSRYTEWLKVWFNVNSSDARLQRAEYIGGSATPIKISEVLQTGATGTDTAIISTPQGTMAGHGISVGSGGSVSKYCEEHGYIMGIMSIMPKTAYQQGIPKHFLRTDKFDYYTPPFAHIGEQPVENQEIMLDTGVDLDGIFGYTPRYAEYKFMNSSVHGDFRTTLDVWHMGRKFKTQPALNQDFIEMDEQETDRIFAVSNYDENGDPLPEAEQKDNLWIHTYHDIKAQRQMAVYGEPKF